VPGMPPHEAQRRAQIELAASNSVKNRFRQETIAQLELRSELQLPLSFPARKTVLSPVRCRRVRSARRVALRAAHSGTNVFRYRISSGDELHDRVCFHTARTRKISQEASSFLSSDIETLSRMFPGLRDGPRYAAPSFGFGFRAASSGFAPNDSISRGGIFGLSPERGNPTFFFHSVQSGKEGAGLNNKVPPVICWILREIPNPCMLGNDKRFQDQHVQVP